MYQGAPIHSRTEEIQTSRLYTTVAALFRGVCIALGILVLLLLPTWSHAEGGPEIRGKVSTGARADFDGRDGSYKSRTYGIDVRYQWFYLDYEHTEYSWKDYRRTDFSRGNKPWGSMDFLRMGARLNGELNEDGLGWFWDGGLVMGWEEEIRRSFGLAGSGGLTYQFTPELSGKIGVWGMAHPAVFRLLPVASLDWNTPEDPGLSLSLGFPETMVRYRLEEGFTLRAGAKADMGERSYRLADDSHVYRKGYITTQGVTAGVYLDAHPVDGLTATFGVEYDMERKYEIRSNNGNRKETIDVENTPSLQFSLGYRF